VLRTIDIYVILGMDWMMEHCAIIQCSKRVVVLTLTKGDRISVDVAVKAPSTAIVNQLSTNKEDPHVDEFQDVFPDVDIC